MVSSNVHSWFGYAWNRNAEKAEMRKSSKELRSDERLRERAGKRELAPIASASRQSHHRVDSDPFAADRGGQPEISYAELARSKALVSVFWGGSRANSPRPGKERGCPHPCVSAR